MSEEDLCELLKFDRKMLRQRINTLKGDKLLQARMKMVTLEDGRTQREQYYFINYKSFVNVVKYKLDHIRKKLEMEERDQTSRASFICNICQRTYTDLEADHLLDIATGQLLCIICKSEVQEDMSCMPRHDTRILLSNFNEQMERLFTLLREVENIKLSAEFNEPKPQDFSNIKKPGVTKPKNDTSDMGNGRAWSGDATKKAGFQVEGSIDVNIHEDGAEEESLQAKSKPIWLTEASSFITTNILQPEVSRPENENILHSGINNDGSESSIKEKSNDVLSLLQAHEKKPKRGRDSDSDSDSGDEKPRKKGPFDITESSYAMRPKMGNVLDEIILSDDDDEEEGIPWVSVGGEKYPITDITNDRIAQMTQEEKNRYINTYQEYIAGIDD